ncbi:MAG TPA: PKD domain-containing protein [Gemmatimonadales bacterium]|nr:PKD domain-containing protein [Gemmatimonadales bacterium]
MSRPVFFTIALVLALACQYEAAVQSLSSTNQAPSSRFVHPNTVAEGVEAAFDARASTDPEGDRLQYAWTFGDGGTAEGSAPHHRYADNCLCTVQLVVTDSRGAADTARVTLEVQNVAPRIDDFTLSVSGTPVGAPIEALMAFHDPGKDDSVTVRIDWGDGETSGGSTHAYRMSGSYVVTAIVQDDDGGIASLSSPSPVRIYDPTGPDTPGVNATVRFLNLEGGCWTIAQDESTHYLPLNLAPHFKRDGLTVRVDFVHRNDYVSACMVGPTIEIRSISER